jgi:tRNA threonylcarbamoyl adenosine modification protein (Sua5/YciO/YrdC/YwlC family)
MNSAKVWECADGADRDKAVGGAVAAMRRGGLVILPTENSYVVATDAFSLRGTALLRRAKMQPVSTPLGLLVASPTTVSGVAARVPRAGRVLMDAFWPGLLTLLMRPQATLSWDHPTGSPLAVRMPLHPFTLAVCSRLGPIAASTATIAGADAPRTVGQALDGIGDDVAGACDAGLLGERSWSSIEDRDLSSTIVDVRHRQVSIVRAGAIDSGRIEAVLERLDGEARDTVAEPDNVATSGQSRFENDQDQE